MTPRILDSGMMVLYQQTFERFRMSSGIAPLQRTIDCNEIYEEALRLFAIHDKEFERVLHLTNPVIDSRIVVSLDESRNEQYSVKTVLIFPEVNSSEGIDSAQAIFRQKFRDIENIVDLENRLNEVLILKSDRE